MQVTAPLFLYPIFFITKVKCIVIIISNKPFGNSQLYNKILVKIGGKATNALYFYTQLLIFAIHEHTTRYTIEQHQLA